jgi:NADH:ubiquinone oxidoreductase subunit C
MKLYFSVLKQLLLLRSVLLILANFGRHVLLCELDNYTYTFYIKKSFLYMFCFFMKYHYYSRFQQLTELTCVDYPQRGNRFTLSYVFLSCFYNMRTHINCVINGITPVLSLVTLFSGVNWQERETWDMFGIMFVNHPDLRRILTDYGFLGHPLRKDFPLSGFVEVYFNDMAQLVCYQPVSLAQEFRDFGRFQNPWQIS